MQYQFPNILHINQVLEAVKDSKEFLVIEKDGYTVINYMVITPETFPEVVTEQDALRRECRGLIFNTETGECISRPYHKFFNLNERAETQQNLVDLAKDHVILEKLDGSMIRPIKTKDGFRLGTKMGVTDISAQPEVFVASHPNYKTFIDAMLQVGYTPIFEWCSRKQRIVVDYPEDRLVLTALRNNINGHYSLYKYMVAEAEYYSIDYVKAYPGTFESMSSLVETAKGLTGEEGWVLRFTDGHMIKVKAEEYVRFHRSKDAITREKNVIDMLLSEKLDDEKAYLIEEDRKRVEVFEGHFWNGVNDTVERLQKNFAEMHTASAGDRKRFAIEYAKNVPPQEKSLYFLMWDGHDARSIVLDTIKRNLSTQVKVNYVRNLWGGHKWDYNFNDTPVVEE